MVLEEKVYNICLITISNHFSNTYCLNVEATMADDDTVRLEATACDCYPHFHAVDYIPLEEVFTMMRPSNVWMYPTSWDGYCGRCGDC